MFEAYPFFSGAQRVTLNLCRALRQKEFHITLLMADDSMGAIRKNFEMHVDEIVEFTPSKRLSAYGNSENWFKLGNFIMSFFFGLVPFFWKCFKFFLTNKFDAIYFCDPRGAVMILVPSLLSRGKKIMFLQSKNKLNPILSRLLFLQFTDHVVCPSVDVLNSLPPSSKKLIINYGIDFSQYKSDNSEKVRQEVKLLSKVDNDNKRAKLLFAGLIKPQKGLHHLIYSLGALKGELPEDEFPLLFILGQAKTPAEINYRDELARFCVQTSIDKYIFWLGWRDNVVDWMRIVDYFVFPTIDRERCKFPGFDNVIESTEGSPVVLIESSLTNLFSIASDVTGVKDTITEMKNGTIYNPNNPDELKNKIKFVLHSKAAFVDFPNKNNFAVDTFAEKFYEIFNKS